MSQEHRSSFGKRFGHVKGILDNDFPESARRGLFHLLDEYVREEWIGDWDNLARELYRLLRIPTRYPEDMDPDDAAVEVSNRINELPWVAVFVFIERVHEKFLCEVTKTVRAGWGDEREEVEHALSEVRGYFERDINALLEEEGFAYRFERGAFVRPGRAHLQAVAERASKVLVRPELEEARRHYAKAMVFFRQAPEPDWQNAVKEAAVALEAALKALFPKCADPNFDKAVNRLGNEEGVAATLCAGMSKLVAYRGAAEGVAHGGANGGPVTGPIVELFLAQVAAYIVFLCDVQASQTRIVPF